MKKMMVVACAMVAAVAAFADGTLPSLRLAGFAICDKVDATVCKARGFSAPEKVVVDKKQGTTCYCCKSAVPTEGYDEVWLVLSPESKIISITGVLLVNGIGSRTRTPQRQEGRSRGGSASWSENACADCTESPFVLV